LGQGDNSPNPKREGRNLAALWSAACLPCGHRQAAEFVGNRANGDAAFDLGDLPVKAKAVSRPSAPCHRTPNPGGPASVHGNGQGFRPSISFAFGPSDFGFRPPIAASIEYAASTRALTRLELLTVMAVLALLICVVFPASAEPGTARNKEPASTTCAKSAVPMPNGEPTTMDRFPGGARPAGRHLANQTNISSGLRSLPQAGNPWFQFLVVSINSSTQDSGLSGRSDAATCTGFFGFSEGGLLHASRRNNAIKLQPGRGCRYSVPSLLLAADPI